MIDKKHLELLAKIKEERKLSATQLAKISNSSIASINKFFANDEKQEIETKKKICKALGVELTEKITYTLTPEPSDLLKELTK